MPCFCRFHALFTSFFLLNFWEFLLFLPFRACRWPKSNFDLPNIPFSFTQMCDVTYMTGGYLVISWMPSFRISSASATCCCVGVGTPSRV